MFHWIAPFPVDVHWHFQWHNSCCKYRLNDISFIDTSAAQADLAAEPPPAAGDHCGCLRRARLNRRFTCQHLACLSESAISSKIPLCQTPVGLSTSSMFGGALHRQPRVGSPQPQEQVLRPAGVNPRTSRLRVSQLQASGGMSSLQSRASGLQSTDSIIKCSVANILSLSCIML